MSPTTPDIMSTLLEPYKDTKPTEQDMEMLRGDSELLVVAGRLVPLTAQGWHPNAVQF